MKETYLGTLRSVGMKCPHMDANIESCIVKSHEQRIQDDNIDRIVKGVCLWEIYMHVNMGCRILKGLKGGTVRNFATAYEQHRIIEIIRSKRYA